jgi:hypothetical protein
MKNHADANIPEFQNTIISFCYPFTASYIERGLRSCPSNNKTTFYQVLENYRDWETLHPHSSQANHVYD